MSQTIMPVEAYKTAAASLIVQKAEKQPKETDEIRELLDDYLNLQRRIDNTEERIAFLEQVITSNLSGMPGGGGDSSKVERTIIKKEELEEKLGKLNAEENRQREIIEEMIELMKNPDQQTAIEMRYFDSASWNAINAALHGKEPDYDENEEKYLKKTFKIHGRALLSLARIYNALKE